MKLIDADALTEKLKKAIKSGKITRNSGAYCTASFQWWYDWLKRIVMRQPTVDAAPVVHAKWRRFVNGDGEYKYLCCECEKIISYEMGGANYCPNCGAKMDGGNEDG